MRFGKRENASVLGSVDPTGTYCAMPDDWLQKKLAEATVAPSRDVLLRGKCPPHSLMIHILMDFFFFLYF